ncbi:MAG: hypothetical protein HY897_26225 [Deltaproteobacteria bacterium]|nr:hypothetical protein [Deltaproteobacteria bacterium]
MRLFISLALATLALGCAMVDTEGPSIPTAGPSMEEAKHIVASFETKQAEKTATEPLRTPKSLDDVLDILRKDQVDLFGPGIDFAAKSAEVRALTLRAQIELAWGEAQLILAETFMGATKHLRGQLSAMEVKEASGGLDDVEKDKLNELRKYIGQTTATAEALSKLAAEHVAAGAKLSREVIEKKPSEYYGYRVAADFYRLRQDWGKFDEMVKKIEETNPNSNGLVFLQGVSAAQREGNIPKAIDFFKKALERDAKFVRAQVQIFLLQSSIPDLYAEYSKLKLLNPNHQIVVWAGDYIERAHEQFKAQRERPRTSK